MHLGWKRNLAHPSVIADFCRTLSQEFSFLCLRYRWILPLCLSLKQWTFAQALEEIIFQSLTQQMGIISTHIQEECIYIGKFVDDLIPIMSTITIFLLA